MSYREKQQKNSRDSIKHRWFHSCLQRSRQRAPLSCRVGSNCTTTNLRTYRVRGGVGRFYGQRILSLPKATLPHLTKRDEPIFGSAVNWWRFGRSFPATESRYNLDESC